MTFTISEVMFMVDIMKEDKIKYLKSGIDKDVLDEYDSIISKLEIRLTEYHGQRKAIQALNRLNS